MSNERLNAIIQMIQGWKETDSYEEDLEKTRNHSRTSRRTSTVSLPKQ
jgi:hypothetical protein